MFKMSSNTYSNNNNNISQSHLINNHLSQKSTVELSSSSSSLSPLKKSLRMRVRGRGIASNNINDHTAASNNRLHEQRRQEAATARRLLSASLDDLRHHEPRHRRRSSQTVGEGVSKHPNRKIFSSMIELPRRSQRRTSFLSHSLSNNNNGNNKLNPSIRLKLKRKSTLSTKPPSSNLIFKITRGFRTSAKVDTIRF